MSLVVVSFYFQKDYANAYHLGSAFLARWGQDPGAYADANMKIYLNTARTFHVMNAYLTWHFEESLALATALVSNPPKKSERFSHFSNTFKKPLGLGEDGVRRSLLVRTNAAGLACPVLSREWSIPDPTSPTLTFDSHVEIWFDPQKGLLPTRIESGKMERGGRIPATAQSRTFDVAEIRPGRFLIIGYEAEHGGWVGNIQEYLNSPEYLEQSGHPQGRFRVRMENTRLGDEVATPTLNLPPGVEIREARRRR